MALIPPIGTSGIYQLAAPFNTMLQSGVSYRCDAVRRISDFIELGIDDPYEEFYQPRGLSREKYDQDLQNQVSIISLVSTSNHWVYVPSTYLLGFPDLNGVPYHVMLLGIEIGAVPEYLNLAGFKQLLSNLTRDTLGMMPTIHEAVISAEERLSQADHEVLENARTLLINNSQTDRAKLLQLQTDYAALQQQYQTLENFVKTLPPQA